MNKIELVGRLTKAPDVRTTTNGISVTTFTVATTRKADKEQSDFHNVVTWRGLADMCGKYLVKGQLVAISGEVQYRTYQDKNGAQRTVTEIIADDVEFLTKPQSNQTAASTSPYGQSRNPATDPNMFNHSKPDPVQQEFGDVMEDEELPF